MALETPSTEQYERVAEVASKQDLKEGVRGKTELSINRYPSLLYTFYVLYVNVT